ncbi:capsular associated protein, partial [Podila verticillata]
MTAYTPLNQQRDSDVEDTPDTVLEEKPFRLTVAERQLAGLLVFFWLICVYVALKVMEVANASHRRPLLPTTNALLDTTSDIYLSLTLPLLMIANHSQLISNRCSTVSLSPHLLSFLDNDLHAQLEEEQGPLVDPPVTEATRQVGSLLGAKASRYLFALVVQDAQEVLPDTLTRIIEAIAILGPNECHLSIVDHGSTDGTKQMIRTLTGYLDRYNREQEEGLSSEGVPDRRADDSDNNKSKRKQHIMYTIITMANQDNSPANLARVKNLALSPMFPRPVSEPSSQGVTPTFDRVVFFEAAVATCTEDILELVYQSQMQDADLACGIDLRAKDTDGESAGVAVLDSLATRDILGKPLGSGKDSFSSDPDTLAHFKKRIPFQAATCWSGVVAIRASLLTSSTGQNPFRVAARRQRQQLQRQPSRAPTRKNPKDTCPNAGSTLLFNLDLWKTKQSSDSTPPSNTGTPSSDSTARIVVVPTSQMQYSGADYAAVSDFDAWGLWSKREQVYRQEHERRLLDASHRSKRSHSRSTSRYGWFWREQEESKVEGEDNEELKAKLATIGAVFGIRDIEDAMTAKKEGEAVEAWRPLVEK